MAQADHGDTARVRKDVRPVLVASRRTMGEQLPCLQRLLVGLADESIVTALVCPPGGDDGRLVAAPAEVCTHPLVDLPLMEHFGVERVAVQLEKFKPTVLHCLCESRAGWVRRQARRLDVPYVLSINGLVKRFSRLPISAAGCMRIVVPSETVRSSVVTAHPRFAERIRQINLGTFVAAEPVCFSDPARLSSIVVAHPLDKVLPFEGLFRGIRSLVKEGREFAVVVMGRGRAERRLRGLVADYDLAEVVTIVPPLDPQRSVLAAGDIFVQPEPNVTFSVPLLEAMGLGMAVVACSGGVDDLIVPNQTALVFEPGDGESIEKNLARLLDDHGFARRLGGTAQTYVEGRHSVGDMISATLETYTSAQKLYTSQVHHSTP